MAVLQPKGTVANVNITPLAQAYAQQQMQNSLDPKDEQTRELARQKIQDFLNQEIVMPKATTIQDIFNAQKGDKLNVFADYLNSPEAKGFIDSFIYGARIDEKGNYLRDRRSREEEARLNAEKEKALELQKEQKMLAGNVFKEANDTDLMNKRLELEDKKLTEEIRHNEASENIAYKNAETSAMKINGKTVSMPASDKKAISENNQTLAAIDDGIKLIKENPNAYTYFKGIVGSDVANRLDPKGVYTRSQIDNITATYRKWLTGAQMSDKERKDYERFLPAPTDNGRIVEQKLRGMKNSIEIKNKAIMGQYEMADTQKKDSLGIL